MDSKYLLSPKVGFEGPFDFELNLHGRDYPSRCGVYAFIIKSGEKIKINDNDTEGSDIINIGSTKDPLACRMWTYQNLGLERKPPKKDNGKTGTAWKIRHFRYFHMGLKVLFKPMEIEESPGKLEGNLNNDFADVYKPLLEGSFERYKTWSIRHGIDEKSFEEPIGGKSWIQKDFEKRFGLPNLP